MKKLSLFLIFILFSIYAYADELSTDNGTAHDSIAVSDNVTETKPKLKIPEKLVPDEYINDRNSYMKDFGISQDQELFSDDGLNFSKKKSTRFVPRNLVMENNISQVNIWEKDNLIVEMIAGAGVLSYNHLSVNQSYAEEEWTALPYGRLHFRFGNGSLFMPEFSIEETGGFNFQRSNLTAGKGENSYSSYFIKFPLGFTIPFFNWQSMGYIDGRYSTLSSNFKLKDSLMVNNQLLSRGSYVNSAGNEWIVRFYFDTPVVRKPSILEHSYAGFYYSEYITPKTANPGKDFVGKPVLMVSTKTRSGGIFFDMKKDVYKGLVFGIEAYGGYAEVEVDNGGSSFGAKFGNVHGMLSVKGKLNLGYTYIFKKQGVGLTFETGAEYNTTIDLIFAKKDKDYNFGSEGDFRYYAELSLIFGY